eukprot:Hpha_TRINITY_DN2487_c0_g1::TRINITY_DN2487_c0_g1_i2::g.24738::m.24738
MRRQSADNASNVTGVSQDGDVFGERFGSFNFYPSQAHVRMGDSNPPSRQPSRGGSVISQRTAGNTADNRRTVSIKVPDSTLPTPAAPVIVGMRERTASPPKGASPPKARKTVELLESELLVQTTRVRVLEEQLRRCTDTLNVVHQRAAAADSIYGLLRRFLNRASDVVESLSTVSWLEVRKQDPLAPLDTGPTGMPVSVEEGTVGRVDEALAEILTVLRRLAQAALGTSPHRGILLTAEGVSDTRPAPGKEGQQRKKPAASSPSARDAKLVNTPSPDLFAATQMPTAGGGWYGRVGHRGIAARLGKQFAAAWGAAQAHREQVSESGSPLSSQRTRPQSASAVEGRRGLPARRTSMQKVGSGLRRGFISGGAWELIARARRQPGPPHDAPAAPPTL